jgi:hypothetical protein
MEHRAGIKPANTNFVGQNLQHYQASTGIDRYSKSTEKYASEFTQWVESGLDIFLGILDQYLSIVGHQSCVLGLTRLSPDCSLS